VTKLEREGEERGVCILIVGAANFGTILRFNMFIYVFVFLIEEDLRYYSLHPLVSLH